MIGFAPMKGIRRQREDDILVTDPDPCPRGLTDADCEERCCIACHAEERLGDDELGAACLTEMAEERLEDARVGLCCSNQCGGYCDRGSH